MTEPTTQTLIANLPDTATDDQVQDAQSSAVLAWWEMIKEQNQTAVGDPIATLENDVSSDTTHTRAWIVTGNVTEP